MKNAMKKLFSLLLVAVLLVSAMPTAFADAQPQCDRNHPNPQFKENTQRDEAPTCTVPGKKAYQCYEWDGKTETDSVHVVYVEVPALGHDYNSKGLCQRDGCGYQCPHENHTKYNGGENQAATCTTPGYECHQCNDCGAFISVDTAIDSSNHSYDAGVVTTNPTCTADGVKTFTCANDSAHVYTEPVAALGHNVVDGACTRCDYTEETTEQEPVIADINWEIKHVAGGAVVNSGSFTPKAETAVAKDILYYHVFNRSNAWREQYTVTKVYSSKAGNDVGENGSIPAGDTVTFVLTPIETPDDNEPDNTPTGSQTLKVYARIWVHETLFDTVELTRINGLSNSDLVYEVIYENKAHLQNCVDGLNNRFPNGFKYIHWNKDVYYKDDGKYYAVTMNIDVGDENEVYINLYSAEQLIVVNVHTSKTWAYDLSVRVEGFREGDTVTYDDVLKAVKKYYNVSSMKIFTYEEMPNYISGKDYDDLDGFIAGEKTDPYEVFITGSRKSGTYTYTADSSNPKTGDMIFAPAIVMGASLTCLAVLFYLNKKRAY